MIKNIAFGLMMLGGATVAMAQEQPTETRTSYPQVQNIAPGDQMFRKTVWRQIDLREKQNKPMFSKNREISRVIIDAVKRGELPVYSSDSLETGRTRTLTEFQEAVTIPTEDVGLSDEEKKLGFTEESTESGWGTEEGAAKPVAAGPEEYFPKDLYTMEIMEEVVFDRKRSRMYYDIKALTLYVPADAPGNARSVLLPVGTFKYSDLVKVFHNDPNAVWFNPQNDAQHKNLADAFALRLFSSFITKVSNPSGDYLADTYGSGKQSLYAAQRTQEELIEYEYNLWSF